MHYLHPNPYLSSWNRRLPHQHLRRRITSMSVRGAAFLIAERTTTHTGERYEENIRLRDLLVAMISMNTGILRDREGAVGAGAGVDDELRMNMTMIGGKQSGCLHGCTDTEGLWFVWNSSLMVVA